MHPRECNWWKGKYSNLLAKQCALCRFLLSILNTKLNWIDTCCMMLRYQGDKNILNIIPNSRNFKVNVSGPHLSDLLSSLLLTAMSNRHAAALKILSEIASWTWTQRECSQEPHHFMTFKMKGYTLLWFCSKDSKELKSKKVFWAFNLFYLFPCSVNIF